MSAESASIHPEALLQHRVFVRALARSLVRDEHAAQDVVQETWLEALRHPPHTAGALRGWLARVVRTRAQNVARGESRRTARERFAAREEADEREERLRERVALQHKVVEAVLGLREPYRTVVLLHYYEGLSPSQIAARKRMPAGTVRAQLSRAHDLLREKLDAEFGGSRAAWSVGLVAFAREPGALALSPKALALAASVAGAIAIPAVLWLNGSEGGESVSPTELAAVLPAERAESIAAVEPEPAQPDPGPSRAPVAAAPEPVQDAIPRAELEAKPVRELLQLAVQTQRTLRVKILTPSEELARSQAVLLAMPSTGLARLIERGKLGSDEVNVLGLRGGGSVFSFATLGQSWDEEPDLMLEKGRFSVQGFGPGVLDLGERRLEDLPDAATAVPAGLTEEQALAWDVCWADAGLTERGPDASYSERIRKLRRLGPIEPAIGHTYLVRGIAPGAHDVLAAFSPLEQDEYGWTIAWRVLRTWPVTRDRRGVQDAYWWVSDPPKWMTELQVEALTRLLAQIRSVAQTKLFEPPSDLRERFAPESSRPGTGLTRLLSRGRYDAVVEKRGGGAFFSFATGDRDYDRQPDLQLEMEKYSSGFHGGSRGLLLDLGNVTLGSIEDSAGAVPTDPPERDREAWQLLWSLRPADEGSRSRAISPADEERVRRLDLDRPVSAQVGHTYLVRSILAGEHDVLAAFTTVARDEHGDWIVWRTIWNRKLEEKPQGR